MRALHRLAVTVGCGLCLAGLSACSSADRTKTVSFEESSPVRTLVIKGQTGDIRVSVGGSAVSVTQKYSYQTAEPVGSHTLADGVLTLSYTCSDSNCGVDYTVQVPAGTAVDISSDTGNVTLSQLTAAVDVQTGTGEITANGLYSSRVQLTADTGDVTAGFAKSPASLSADVSTGDVSISVPAGEYAVNAQATTGDVNVQVPWQAGSGNTITVKVGTGDVTVS